MSICIGLFGSWIGVSAHQYTRTRLRRQISEQALAPLLVLCENEPTEVTLPEERELIRQLAVPREVRSDLLAIAVMATGVRNDPTR